MRLSICRCVNSSTCSACFNHTHLHSQESFSMKDDSEPEFGATSCRSPIPWLLLAPPLSSMEWFHIEREYSSGVCFSWSCGCSLSVAYSSVCVHLSVPCVCVIGFFFITTTTTTATDAGKAFESALRSIRRELISRGNYGRNVLATTTSAMLERWQLCALCICARVSLHPLYSS